MWDINVKVTNEETRKQANKNSWRQTTVWLLWEGRKVDVSE